MESSHHAEKQEAEPQFQEATEADCELMFRLQKLDGAELDPQNISQAATFEEYKKSFVPAEIQVIFLGEEPVGRLRVVRGEEIYIGGMQILPEHRGKGIGTKILQVLIHESEQTQTPIRLEVFHGNQGALNLYEKMGFKVTEENEKQKIMTYSPGQSFL